jgi:hopanoid biosynthesis associated radical SAM protein HpnH
MLEPLFQCNLSCNGCGKIRYPDEILAKRLSVDDCINAAQECGAPVVSIPGGEPLLHPDIHHIVAGLTQRKRFVYLCTNALLVKKRIHQFVPSPYLTFNIHIDGLGEKHDAIVSRKGVFDRAVAAIRLLLSKGFRVTTNTTFFGRETPASATALFDFLTSLKVEGMTVSAGFSYEKVSDKGSFLDRAQTRELFDKILEKGHGRKWRFNHSRLYLQFLAGRHAYTCTPWDLI